MDVRKNEGRSRYELFDEDQLLGVADYRIDGDRIVFPHTEIVADRRGSGLGAVLIRGALDDVRPTGRSIVPACWFVADFVRDNPAYGDLVA
jgi:uncharacterized protein